MATTTFSSLSQRTTNFAYANHLVHAEPILLASTMGKKLPIPANKSDTVKFRRVIPLTAATAALTEGAAPTAVALTYEDVTVALGQYGNVIEITDKVTDTAEDPVLTDATAANGENHAETIELLTLGVLKGGTNVAYTGAHTQRDAVATAFAIKDVRAVERFLKGKRAKPVSKYVPSTTKYGSEAVRPAFVAIGHTDALADLELIAGWTPIEKYGDAMGQLPYEAGKVGGVRFCLSPLMPVWANGGGAKGTQKSTSGTLADVYPLVFFGEDAYGSTSLAGKKDMELYVVKPQDASLSNPLGQKGTVGWKSWFAAMILNQNWVIRVEHSVTA